MQGGEIFVPKLPSMKVTDVADVIAPEADREIIGMRPGEKLHEILLTEEEASHSSEFEDCFIIEPEHPFWKSDGLKLKGGKPLAEGFRYASDNNSWWLTKDDLRKVIEEQ
jgi:UDP-N-acetylglucosamine 4,6-dehydratase